MKSKKMCFLSIFIIMALLFIPNTVDAINKYPEIDKIKYSLDESTKTAKVEDYYGSDTELVIPSEIESEGIKYTVTSIKIDAFQGLTMAKIEIPASITSIGNGAFNECRNLTSIEVDGLNLNYCSVDGVLFNKDKTTIIKYPEAKEETTYIIPNSVKTIDIYAFYQAKNLTDITIPNSVETIGVSAFNTCSSLTSIVIPDGVQAIESGTFYQCTSLESVILPKNLKRIGTQAFFNCTSLKSITIPEALESTGTFAFSYCTSLTISGYPNSLERTFATNNNINFDPKYKVTNRLSNITSNNENIGVNYTITLKADSGYKLPGNIKIIINNTELEEKDYTYDRTNGNIVIFDTAIIGDIEIEAIGEKLIKVSFDANSGKFSDGTNIINFDDANDCDFDNIAIPTRDGYKFIGYYTEKTGGTSMSDFFNNEAGITEDTTFYAQWEKVYSYTFIIGESQTFTLNKIDEYGLKIDGDHSLFNKLIISTLNLVKDVDFKVTEGSTIITFTETGLAKLNTLVVGTYDVVVEYSNDKEVTGKLIIEADTTIEDNTGDSDTGNTETDNTSTDNTNSGNNPQTSDNIMLFVAVLGISIIGIIATTKSRKKLKNN